MEAYSVRQGDARTWEARRRAHEGEELERTDGRDVNEAVKAEVIAAVAKWRPRLRLNDWSVSFVWDAKLDDDAAMSSDVQTKYRRFYLRVRTDTKNDSWQTVEKQVVHELVHAVTEEPIDTVSELLNGLQVGRLTFEAVDTAMRFSNERVTELVARVVWEAWERTAWDQEPAGS